MTNPWIEHVRRYAKEHDMSYSQALKEASASYGGGVKKVAAKVVLKSKNIRNWLTDKIVNRVVADFGNETGGFGIGGGIITWAIKKKIKSSVDTFLSEMLPQYIPDPDEQAYIVDIIHAAIDSFVEDELEWSDSVKGYKVVSNISKYKRTGEKTKDDAIRARIRSVLKTYIKAVLDDPQVRQIIINNVENF